MLQLLTGRTPFIAENDYLTFQVVRTKFPRHSSQMLSDRALCRKDYQPFER